MPANRVAVQADYAAPRRTIPAALQWTLVVLLLLGAAVLAGSVIRNAVVWDVGDTGIATTVDLVTINVEPGSSAARAGLRDGDRIEPEAMSLRDRLISMWFAAKAGQQATIVVRRGASVRSYQVTVAAVPRTAVRLTSQIVQALVSIFGLVLSASVLVRVRSIDAVALALFLSGFLGQIGSIDSFGAAMVIGMTLVWTLSNAGSLLLVARASGVARWERLLVAAGTVLFIFTYTGPLAALLLAGLVPPQPIPWLIAENIAPTVGYATCFAILVIGLAHERGPGRVRVQWFAAAFAGFLLVQGVNNLGLLRQFAFSEWLPLALWLLEALAIMLLAYPILRHDLFGVGFVVNRAAIYAVLTAVIVGVFAGVNWLIGTALKSAGLALPVDVGLAALAGLSVNLVQRRVNRIVDRVLFRRRYEAARRLRTVVRALNHATDNAMVADAIVVEPCEALDLHAAALFTRVDNGSFARIAERGWPPDAPAAIAAGDRFIVHLIGGDERPVRMEDVPHPAGMPHGAPRPRTAFPLWSRRELVGVALYSAHRNGATLDPEEVDEIERITSAATAAFDRVAAAELRRTQVELAAARAEIARLTMLRNH